MRILAVTNMYPTAKAPHSGIFVEQQIKALRAIGVNVDLMIVERLERGLACYLGLTREIQAKIRDSQPDIVHVMYGGVMANIVTRTIRDRPTIVTFHGSDLLGEHLSGHLRKIIARYGVRSSRKAARRASHIVAVSQVLRDALPHDINRSKVSIIPCGIDLGRFRPLNRDACRQDLGWHGGRFHVLFPAAAGDPVKRSDLAQAAVDIVSRSGIAVEMHHLCGVENNLVPVWLNASDVLLLTSLHEGSPTVVKEALACNLPVVSVDVGDVRERVDGIEGCYLASPDPDHLAASLQRVLRQRRRVAGRCKMEELSLERVALRLKKLYENVLGSIKAKREMYSVHQMEESSGII
jgi:glycosyltransferase involved in cell wall biosynthesis